MVVGQQKVHVAGFSCFSEEVCLAVVASGD